MSIVALEPEKVVQVLRAANRIVATETLAMRLKDPDGYQAALGELGLPESSDVRGELLNLRDRIRFLGSGPGAEMRLFPLPVDAGKTAAGRPAETDPDMDSLLLESFDYIRWTFWISLGMSGILFLVGLALMGIAIWRFLTEPTVTAGSLTIAGLGLADFLLLFYTRPWQDISSNLANSHKIKMIGTSYLAGLTIVQNKNAGDLRLLHQLTRGSVRLLDQPAASRSTRGDRGSKGSAPKPDPE